VTRPLYHTDAYLAVFDATVIGVDGAAVVLDRTTFYPGGGGQPHDLGTLAAGGRTWRVSRVRKRIVGPKALSPLLTPPAVSLVLPRASKDRSPQRRGDGARDNL
jgi:Ser-tRNA(Ala) deacylase AlaX